MFKICSLFTAETPCDKVTLLSVAVVFPLFYIGLLFMQPGLMHEYRVLGWLLPVVLLVGLSLFFVLQRNQLGKHQKQGELFKAVADSSLEFTFVRDLDGKYTYVSPAVVNVTGYTPEDFYQTPNFMNAIIHPSDELVWENHVHRTNDNGDAELFEFRIVTKQGEERWLQHLCGPIYNDSGKQLAVRSINVDISERRKADAKVERLGFYDPLTGLPNRQFLTDYLLKMIDKSENRAEGEEFAVIFIDLDRFQYINDAHGHSVGDQLLKEVAQRFNVSCLASKKAMISRFGGDEFVVVTRHDVSTESIQECVAHMNQLLEAPFRIQGHHLSIGVSAGVAVYPLDGMTPEALVKNADAAMFKAKKQGLNMAFFSQEMCEHAVEMVDLRNRLKSAINGGLIQPHYQPLIDLKTNEIVGVEVLARWMTEDGSIAPSPAVFIPVSEDCGLIWALSETMIAQAGRDINAWLQQGVKVKFSVNVSARQFSDEIFCEQMISQFQCLGVSPDNVQIELTESLLISNVEQSFQKIKFLKQQGFKIALDDFGTGYSSLQYLTQFPFDTLKVDRAFVTNIMDDERQFAIAKSIINLAHDLDLQVVAEGIETQEQRKILTDLGCDIGQGFLFSRPVAQEQISKLFAA